MPVSPMKFTKISDLPKKEVMENDQFIINTNDTKLDQTSVASLYDIREGVYFSNAANTIAEGLASVDDNEMFFVYDTAAKFSVLQYMRVRNQASPVIGSDGKQRRFPTYLSMLNVTAISETSGYDIIGKVDNFSALRSIKPTYTGQRVILAGYFSGSSLGSGEFVGYAGTANDDGGTTASGDGFYWKRNKTAFTLEDFGGGQVDDTEAMRASQKAQVGPITLSPGKTYYYSSPVKHYSKAGWIGNGASIVFRGTGNRIPFISSPTTAAGVDNDRANGSTAVTGAIFKDLTIDVNYVDTTGALGFEFGENTLDNWTNCVFTNVTFKNGKFDNLGLQNNSTDNQFIRCTFINAGEDSVTVRGGCLRNEFVECDVVNSAQVAHRDGTFYGDGIVNKGRDTLIKSCRFINIGNGKKGAGIANNAEDTKNADEASNGTYLNNYFINCYGGFGFGTVNPDFIAAGDLIKGIKAIGNVFVNTLRTVIGIRDLYQPVLLDNVILTQSTGNVTTIEITNCTNFQMTGRVTDAAGSAITITSSSGKVDLVADNVSTTKTLNGVVITDSNRITGSIRLINAQRRGCTFSNCNNMDLDLYVESPAQDALEAVGCRYSNLDVKLVNVPEHGMTLNGVVESNIKFNINDAGVKTPSAFYPIRLLGVRNSILSGVSSSANANKPLYDITSDANNVNVLIANSRLGAGTTGKVQVGQGSTITQNNII
ncbi:putative tail fiber protein [Serratia phage vB_SmaM_Yaphecito]|uniref:Putative tail fiber protein n=1 Tax=Serratia phage vB_SmaM_Yaphecito TaxID=2777368 RepID=A0A7T3NC27_9CAUD|nr:putative tail fiber protein [Serratia phage vB_SmaM_Yaphecito]